MDEISDFTVNLYNKNTSLNQIKLNGVNKVNDGGPVHPSGNHKGITLRDHAILEIIKALYAGPFRNDSPNDETSTRVVCEAMGIADKFIRNRHKEYYSE